MITTKILKNKLCFDAIYLCYSLITALLRPFPLGPKIGSRPIFAKIKKIIQAKRNMDRLPKTPLFQNPLVPIGIGYGDIYCFASCIHFLFFWVFALIMPRKTR